MRESFPPGTFYFGPLQKKLANVRLPRVAGKKKRSKDSHNNSSGSSGNPVTFQSGGTWPRTKGGPIIEQGTGTIIHPQKMKKGEC